MIDRIILEVDNREIYFGIKSASYFKGIESEKWNELQKRVILNICENRKYFVRIEDELFKEELNHIFEFGVGMNYLINELITVSSIWEYKGLVKIYVSDKDICNGEDFREKYDFRIEPVGDSMGLIIRYENKKDFIVETIKKVIDEYEE